MSTPAEIKINECQADINELKSFYATSSREVIKQLLKSNLEKLEADLNKLKKAEQDRLAKLNSTTSIGTSAAYNKKMFEFFFCFFVLFSYCNIN